MSITRTELQEWLEYDPSTGVFYARKWRRNIKGVGEPVGWLDDRGYTRLFLHRKLYLAHRLAWFWVHGVWPASEIDHINGNRNDNRIVNLREATELQNARSRFIRKDVVNPFKGITKAKRRGVWCGRWQAQICVNRKVIHLGFYRDPVLAAKAYDFAAEKHFGAFAKTNRMLGLL